MTTPETRTVAYRLHLPVDVPLGTCTFQVTTHADEHGVTVEGPVMVLPVREPA